MKEPIELPSAQGGPPDLASRLLIRSLGPSAESLSILGDLCQDFAQIARDRGSRRARWWFWREALLLSLTVSRCTRRGSQPHRAAPFGRLTPRRSTLSNTDHLAALGLDARYALHAVRKDFRLFIFAVLIVGLGVGACTAVFSILDPLMLRELPFEDPSRLVWIANKEEGGMSAITSRTFNLRDFRAYSRSFDGLTGYDAFFEQQSHNLEGNGEPVRAIGVGVADDFLDVLGVEPLLGRDFVPEEERWGGPLAVIFSHAFWKRQFGGDPAVVGTSISLDNQPHEVVGVLPPSFDFVSTFAPDARVDFLRPFPISDETDQEGNTLSMIGRLAAGATVGSAQADLERVIRALREEDPQRRGLGAVVTGLQPKISGPFRSAMFLLAAAAAATMLIVCVNLSNLLLAKGARRSREMAVRSALGAPRARLVRQMLIESLVLSASGTLCGLLIALAATRFVASAKGLSIPLLRHVSIDGGALLFSVAGLAGLLPARRASRTQAAAVLRTRG